MPRYKKIYYDLLTIKFPEKFVEFQNLFKNDKEFTHLEVIKINNQIFNNKNNSQSHRAYDNKTIFEILDYQKKKKINNTQLALHFNLSRNTVAKWKKKFLM